METVCKYLIVNAFPAFWHYLRPYILPRVLAVAEWERKVKVKRRSLARVLTYAVRAFS